jgi:hypothetical protein
VEIGEEAATPQAGFVFKLKKEEKSCCVDDRCGSVEITPTMLLRER